MRLLNSRCVWIKNRLSRKYGFHSFQSRHYKNIFLPNIHARKYKLHKEKIHLLCTWKVHKKVISAIASIKSRFESLHKPDRQILKLRLSLVFNMKMCTKIMFYGWKLVFLCIKNSILFCIKRNITWPTHANGMKVSFLF